MTTNALVTIKNMTFEADGCRILDNISFSIDRGQYVTIVGPNGAGKSTLLKCINGIHRTWQGQIILAEKSQQRYSQKEIARLISYVEQSSNDELLFTVREYVLMGRYPYMSPFSTIGSRDKAAVSKALDMTGSTALANRTMASLSGGERQKVNIAAAIAQEAELMVLDEPATFLDPAHQAEVFAILDTLNREQQITIIAVTHDVNHALLHSHRIIALKNGVLLFDGPPTEITGGTTLEKIYGVPFVSLSHPSTHSMLIFPETA